MIETNERLSDLVSVVAFCRANGLRADVVGRWVWIRFDAKPDANIRAKLKAAGFRWVSRRGEWAHDCGHPSTRGTGNPRWKYGEVPVSAFGGADYSCSDRGYEDQCRSACGL